jgi:hypothetical protein
MQNWKKMVDKLRLNKTAWGFLISQAQMEMDTQEP